MRWRFENNAWGVAKLLGLIVGTLLALWLAGVLLRAVGALLLGLVGLISALLRFGLLAAVVIGVGYLLALVLKNAQRREPLEAATAPEVTHPQGGVYPQTEGFQKPDPSGVKH